MASIYWAGVVAVLAMYGAFLVVGWLAARRLRGGTPADVLLAGRAMPLWLATLTMTATWVDGGYLLGTAEGAFKTGLASGIQGGLCFGISLIGGGLFFAKRMRRLEFTTLVDPFEARFGTRWAAVLMVPALMGELFWSAELLVAIGSTFGVILGMDLTAAILVSAAVVTAYTMVGGMWSVAYTDAFQLALIPIGLVAALPFVFARVGGIEASCDAYFATKGSAARLLPPLGAFDSFWTRPGVVAWWDLSAMLVLGGIPWNCYFQRVLSCETATKARWHSIFAGVLTVLLTVPPLLFGIAAVKHAWSPAQANRLAAEPALVLPLAFRELVPAGVGILGLGAIVGAVTSSFSSSILSAGSMLSWNVYRPLLAVDARVDLMKRVIRWAILLLGAAAAWMAVRVHSVQALWFFSSDLVFVLLFPQLVCALYDRRANRIGSIAAFAISLVLRLGGGEPLFGLDPFLPYPEWWSGLSGGDARQWYDASGHGVLFPFRTLAAAAGLILLPLVSRLTGRWDPPRPLESGR
jgi:high affinity choline transporter 7